MKLFQISMLLLICMTGCKEEYLPNIKSEQTSILVVEGVINSGQGVTTIRLSRTFKLDDSAQLRPETGAQLTLESKSGAVFSLFDMAGNGVYSTEQLNLNATEEYRLRIKTAAGNEYASSYVPVKETPPIDSISWKRVPEGARIFVNTHDASDRTRYYKWEYEETWELRSTFFSRFKFVNDAVVMREENENVFFCWRSNASTSINVGSSARLQSDVIAQSPLLLVPQSSEKIAVRYSILVKQYALTKEAFEFYQLMKKNTETLGSIFDAQPSEITGNVRSLTDPDELVIGFITASTIEEKRIFIQRDEVDPGWGFRMFCETREISTHPDSIRLYFPHKYLPYEGVYMPSLIAYYASDPACTDCTLRGGSTQKPSFW